MVKNQFRGVVSTFLYFWVLKSEVSDADASDVVPRAWNSSSVSAPPKQFCP